MCRVKIAESLKEWDFFITNMLVKMDNYIRGRKLNGKELFFHNSDFF